LIAALYRDIILLYIDFYKDVIFIYLACKTRAIVTCFY